MKFIKKNLSRLLVAVFVLVLFVLPVLSFAQGGATPEPCDKSGKICNPIQITTISGLIKKILEGAIKIGLPIVVLAIVYCGFLFVAARGNSEKLTKAKDALLYTLIGAAILLGSWAIAELISGTVTGLAA